MLVATIRTVFVPKLIFIRFTCSFILSMVYDYEPKAKDDHIVHVVERYMELMIAALTPGATLVMETFPFRMCTHAVMPCS